MKYFLKSQVHLQLYIIFRAIRIVSVLLSIVVILVNIFFVYNTVDEWELEGGAIAAIGVGAVLYLVFCVYLAIHLAAAMGNKTLRESKFVQKYVTVNDNISRLAI